MKGNRAPGLDELAFEGRNHSYGAYFLRKRYPRYLLVSVVIGSLIMALTVLAAWLNYYLAPSDFSEGMPMYEVEYLAMSAPPEDLPADVVQAFARPEPETEKLPVVTDSVVPEKQPPLEEPPKEKKDETPVHTDTAATAGGSGQGTGVGDDTGIASQVDVYPRFPGGDESRLTYLRRQVRYPETALKSQTQGVVMVVFVVEPDGTLTHVDVVKRIGGGCDEEAIRVTKEMPRWDPGKRNGKPVRVMVRMPIVFRIPGKFVTFGK